MNLDLALGNVGGDFDLSLNVTPGALLDGIDGLILDPADVDTRPHPLVQLRPLYPPHARMRSVEGMVHLEFVVDANGGTRDIQVVSAYPAETFVSTAIRAVQRWRFEPGVKNGKAVPVRMSQKVVFRLEE